MKIYPENILKNNSGNASVLLLSLAFLGVITAKSYEHLTISENLQNESIAMKVRQAGKQVNRNSLLLAAGLLRSPSGKLPSIFPLDNSKSSKLYPDPYYPIKDAQLEKSKGFPKPPSKKFEWSFASGKLKLVGEKYYLSQKNKSGYDSTVNLKNFVWDKKSDLPHLIEKVQLESKSNVKSSKNSGASDKQFKAKAKLYVSPPPVPTCEIECTNCRDAGIVAPEAMCVVSPPVQPPCVQITNPDGTQGPCIPQPVIPAVMASCAGNGGPNYRPGINTWDADVLPGSNININIKTYGVVTDAQIGFHPPPTEGGASEINQDAIDPETTDDFYNNAPYPDANRVAQVGSILSNFTFSANETGVYTVWLAGPGNLKEREIDSDGKPTGNILSCLDINDEGTANVGSCSANYNDTLTNGVSQCTFALHVVDETDGCDGSEETDLATFNANCGNNGGGDSFYGSTKIVMEDGSEKAIRDVRVGDKVWNPVLKDNSKVEEIISEDVVADLLEFKFGNSKIIVTNKHPLLTTRGYVSAVAVKLGDELLIWGGESGIVKSIQYVKKRGEKVFDLILDRNLPQSSRFYVAEGIIAPDFDYQIDIQRQLLRSSKIEAKHINLDELFNPTSSFDRTYFEPGSPDNGLASPFAH